MQIKTRKLISDILDCSEITENDKNKESIDQIFFKYEQEIKNYKKIHNDLLIIGEENEKNVLLLKENNENLNIELKEILNENKNLKIKNEDFKKNNNSLKIQILKLENKLKEFKQKRINLREVSYSKEKKYKNSNDYLNSGLIQIKTKKKKTSNIKDYSLNRKNVKSFLGKDYISISKSIFN